MHVGASDEHYQPVHVENELAWHNVFCQSLFIKPSSFNPAKEDVWTLRSLPNFECKPELHGTNSDGAIMVNFSEKKVLILGIAYAGEMKKSMFGVMNFILPDADGTILTTGILNDISISAGVVTSMNILKSLILELSLLDIHVYL